MQLLSLSHGSALFGRSGHQFCLSVDEPLLFGSPRKFAELISTSFNGTPLYANKHVSYLHRDMVELALFAGEKFADN